VLDGIYISTSLRLYNTTIWIPLILKLSVFIACPLNTAEHVSGILMPIIRSLSSAVAASGLLWERGGSSAVGRGRSGPDRPRPTTLLPPRSYGKSEAATADDKLLMMGVRMPEIR
jgi:hypothetical protein